MLIVFATLRIMCYIQRYLKYKVMFIYAVRHNKITAPVYTIQFLQIISLYV